MMLGSGKARRTAMLLEKAMAYEEEGRYADAIHTYREAGGSPEARERIRACWYALGCLHRKNGNPEEAVFSFRRSEGFEDALLQIREIESAQGNADGADPGDEAAERTDGEWYRIGEEHFAAGRYAEAIPAFENADGYADAPDRWQESIFMQASELLRQGRAKDAAALLDWIRGNRDAERLIAVNPDLKAETDKLDRRL